MRLLVALLFLSSHVLAKSVEDTSINFSTESHPNFYDELPGPPLHTRVKRSVFAALGISTQCEPGWTGQFCENPICSGNVTSYLAPPQPLHIDHLYLPSGCPGKYYIPYDSFSYGMYINVLASGIPYINLTDANGNLVQGSGAANEGIGYMIYPETLLPGGYQLTIDNGGVPTADCIVEIQAYSWLNAVTGFSSSPQSDVLPQSESGIDGTPMYFVTHPMNVTNPGQTRSVTLRNEKSMTPIYRSVLTQRYGCAYEYYAGQFTCDKWNRYVAHIDGIDSNGYPFRRSKTFTCVEQLTTTPAPTTQPPPFTCYNGGILHNANQPSAWCFCPELFTGNQCQQPACMNGGFLAPSGTQCECPTGYSGINCEHVICEPNLGQYLTDYNTLILVIRNSVSMNQNIPGIVQAVKNEVEGHDGVYSNFLLIPFVDGVYIPRRYTDAQYSQFIAAVANLGNSSVVGNCSDVTFPPIYDVFNQYVYDKSSIFLFTDAVPSDVDAWRSVTESNSRRKLPIFSFFYPQSSCGFDSLSPGYQAIQNANLYSGGLGFIVTDPTQLTSFFYFVLRSTTAGMNLVYANDLDRCAGNIQRSFMIDSSTEDIMVMVTGENIMMTMTDPNWNTQVMMQMSKMGNSYYVYEVMPATTGEYIFSIATADPQQSCSIRVMARSQYDLFFATSLGNFMDAIDSEPVVGQPVHLVAQLNGLYNATLDPYRLFSELTITTNRNNARVPGLPMYYSNGQYRDDCGYHLYFGVANFCEKADQPFYATVFADDNQGFTIQRTTIGYCSLSLTTVSPPGTCQNGGVLDPETNSTCICPVGFVGDYCQQIVCQNGGTPAGAFCVCTPGASGTFCELYTCPLINPTPANSFDGQTMIFVVAARPSMQDTWNQLASTVGDFVRDVQGHSPNWIKNWVLFTINGQDEEKIVDDPNPQAFVDGIKMVAANLSAYSSPTDDGCSVQIMSGILYAAYKSEKRSSIYLFTDASGPDTMDYSNIFQITLENQITINTIQTANTICTPDGQLPYYIRELSYITNGFVYETTKVSQMLYYITSMYKSGVSAQISADDCTEGVTKYIAVDGWTQAFSIATFGDNISSVNVWTPDGTEAIYTYQVNMIQDPKLDLKQFLAPCPMGSDAGWTYMNQYCYTANVKQFTWYNASMYCHSLGGSLADVLSQKKSDDVHFMTQKMNNWIGLTRTTIGGQPVWFWDVPNGNHFQPLDPSYTNWCNNTAIKYPVDDADKNCVIMDPSGCWQNVNCYDNHLFVCQMHRYGQGLYPGDANNNIVPGGRWKVQIKTNSGSCYAQVRSQSEIQMFFGFVQEPHQDFPSLFANPLSSTNYIVTNPTNLSPFQFDGDFNSMEGNLNYNFIGFNNTLTYPLTVSNRWFCGYPYVSQPFSCPDSSSAYSNFYVKFSGIDQYGFAFDRFADAVCLKTFSTCNNGGSLVNGQCICPAGWTGETCSSPICQNDGVDYGGQCKCQPMFTGTFCELPFCEPPVPASFGDSGRTLAIVLETSYNMGSTIFQMKKSLQAALDSITQDPTTAGWFSQFILYPFDSTFNKAQWYPVVKSTRTIDIVNAVKSIPTMTCPGNGTCSTSCPRPFLGAIQDVLSMPEFASPNSLVLVITRSSSEESGVSSALSQLLQETKAQVNFILPATDSPCSEGWSSQGVTNMYRTVQYSDGNLFVMSAVDVCSNFLTQYVPTIYKSSGLESAQIQNCGNSEVLFQVEHEMYEFTIDYYMPQANPPFVITLTDPSGDTLALPQSIITSDSNYLGVIKVNDTGYTRAGTYRLNIKGGLSNYCYINIRGRSSIELYPGFVGSNDGYNGAITDSAHYAPVFLDSNTIVIHANGLNGGVLTYAQIVEGSVGLAHTTNLLPRDSQCSYEWYGNLPFDCNHMNFALIVYGRDARGANFHRKYLITAVSTRPVPPPPPAKCNLQDVKQDILFMIDSSLKGNNDTVTYNQLKAFAGNAVTPYRFSNSTAQVGALTVADIAYGGFSFFAASNWNDVNRLLMNLSYSGQPGQNTSSGFQMVIDRFDREQQGYRPDPSVRHSIIYLTATNPTDVDSMEMVNRVRRSGLYGVAIVAYNMVPNQSLTQMVPNNCLYVANSLEDLNNYGTNFVRQLSCAHNPPCGM